jgi:hypothetical protein
MVPSGIDKEKFCLQLERLEEKVAEIKRTRHMVFRVRHRTLKAMKYDGIVSN